MVSIEKKRDAEAELNLPSGFRFHPTDEELVVHYLCNKVARQCLPVQIIAEIDLYKYNPWELPEKALFGQREWYFFTPRDRKYPNGSRPNRSAGEGYWKATGADKPVSPKGSNRVVGIKKALVFYSGKAPKGIKSDWIMHEYRIVETNKGANKKGSLRLDDWVLCRLYNKKNSWNKVQKQQKDESSFGETMDSAIETVSDSFRTPESDMDSEIALPEFDDIGQFPLYPNQVSSRVHSVNDTYGYELPAFDQRPKEDDWFTGLDLEDLQTSSLNFGFSTSVEIANQDLYFSSFASVGPISNQNMRRF